MTFHGPFKDIIEEGDTCILFQSVLSVEAVVLKKDGVFNCRHGAFFHNTIIGKPYGSKIVGHKNTGWLYALHPSSTLWTTTLPHRTQILYSTDISMIIAQLGLKPGSIVCESGTGSGSLSHAILQTIAPTGHLYTYEFHAERAQKAREEFERHGLGSFVTVTHADACRDGFKKTNEVDAVFLDLPSPWLAIDTAVQALKTSGGRLCSFSPCIEQVQRTCDTLRAKGFVDLVTLECLERNYEVRAHTLPEVSFAPPVPTAPRSQAGIGKASGSAKDGSEQQRKRQRTDAAANDSEAGQKEDAEEADGDEDGEVETEAQGGADEEAEEGNGSSSNKTSGKAKAKGFKGTLYARTVSEMKGHTGFLTFATWLHPLARYGPEGPPQPQAEPASKA